MLDDFAALSEADSSGFLSRLVALPQSYDGPEGLQAEPYGLMAYGEAANLGPVLEAWLDAPVVLQGSQFVLAGGFDYGGAPRFKLSAEMTDSTVIVLGHGVHEPNLSIAADVLSPYTYINYLAHATGHKEDIAQANDLMKRLASRLGPEVETAQNPAKTLAWTLWNRVPLLLASRAYRGLGPLLQSVFARVGKSLAITTGAHPLAFVTGALEGRHQFGDDLVALLVGKADKEQDLAKEVLSSRIAQVDHLLLAEESMPKDTVAYSLVTWYGYVWVAAYLALLHKLEPADSPTYQKVQGLSLEL